LQHPPWKFLSSEDLGSRLEKQNERLLALTKPRVTLMVLWTAAIGCFLAAEGEIDWLLVFHTISGTALLAAGTAVLNQVMERREDSRMQRTAKRPLPAGRIRPAPALLFGLGLVTAGTAYLAAAVNPLVAILGGLTSVVYLALYTPLKKYTPFCTVIGAIPGATPPLMGWAAIRGELGWDAFLLFLVVFGWQVPHFLAIALLYREDYQRGGFYMLPDDDSDGRKTGTRILISTLMLTLVSLMLSWSGLLGGLYLTGAVFLGAGLLWVSYRLARSPSRLRARSLLRASVLYLPLLLAFMVIDRI